MLFIPPWDPPPPPCLWVPDLSLAYMPPPPGSHPCPPPPPVWVRTSSGSLALLTPSQQLAQPGAIACLLAQPSHTPHIPAKEMARWEESGGVFHSSVSGHLAQCSVIWYISKCLTLSTAIYREERLRVWAVDLEKPRPVPALVPGLARGQVISSLGLVSSQMERE